MIMAARQQIPKRKNVLIIMSDEQRADTLGCYGNKLAQTPHIDQLASEGIRLEGCYTPYPLCCPARTSIWTGLMLHNHHVIANWFLVRPDLREGGLISRFTESGYHTTYTGKWHVPGTTPGRLGFRAWAAVPDVVDGRDRGRYISEYRAYAKSQGYELVEKNMENMTRNDLVKKTKNGYVDCGTADIKLEHYLETWQTDKFLEQMESCPGDRPFFAVCSYNAPHFPMIVPAPYDKLIDPEAVQLPPNFCAGLEDKPGEVLTSDYYTHSQGLSEEEWRRLIAHYWGFCSLVDEQVGKIVAWLKANGKYEDTIIVYTTDHGDMLGAHCLNHKGFEMQYEETNRIPMIIVNPEEREAQVRRMFVSLIDLLPTLAELCGVSLDCPIDGKSFAKNLKAGKDDSFRPYAISESFDLCHSGKGEYENPEHYTAEKWRAMNICIRAEHDKYIFHGKDSDEYYDMMEDPYENCNLYPNKVSQERISELRTIILDELEKSGTVLANLVQAKMKA